MSTINTFKVGIHKIFKGFCYIQLRGHLGAWLFMTPGNLLEQTTIS